MAKIFKVIVKCVLHFLVVLGASISSTLLTAILGILFYVLLGNTTELTNNLEAAFPLFLIYFAVGHVLAAPGLLVYSAVSLFFRRLKVPFYFYVFSATLTASINGAIVSVYFLPQTFSLFVVTGFFTGLVHSLVLPKRDRSDGREIFKSRRYKVAVNVVMGAISVLIFGAFVYCLIP